MTKDDKYRLMLVVIVACLIAGLGLGIEFTKADIKSGTYINMPEVMGEDYRVGISGSSAAFTLGSCDYFVLKDASDATFSPTRMPKVPLGVHCDKYYVTEPLRVEGTSELEVVRGEQISLVAYGDTKITVRVSQPAFMVYGVFISVLIVTAFVCALICAKIWKISPPSEKQK